MIEVTEILLKQLSNSDIDWLKSNSRREKIAPGTVVVEQGKPVEQLQLILDGIMGVYLSVQQEIMQFSSGELLGAAYLVDSRLPVYTVKAIHQCQVLTIPISRLQTKISNDISFATHFYKAVAMLIPHQLRWLNRQLGNEELAIQPQQSLKKVLFFFGQLNDSDIDWLLSAGKREKILAGQDLIRQGRPVDSLYMLMEGNMSLFVCTAKLNCLSRTFAIDDDAMDRPPAIAKWREYAIANLSRGEIVGEMSFLNNDPAAETISATEDCQLLSLSRHQLVAKLQTDHGFAHRFYFALSVVLLDRWRSTLVRLGNRQPENSFNQTEDENELNLEILEHTSVAGARFDWIMRRFRTLEAV